MPFTLSVNGILFGRIGVFQELKPNFRPYPMVRTTEVTTILTQGEF